MVNCAISQIAALDPRLGRAPTRAQAMAASFAAGPSIAPRLASGLRLHHVGCRHKLLEETIDSQQNDEPGHARREDPNPHILRDVVAFAAERPRKLKANAALTDRPPAKRTRACPVPRLSRARL